MGYVKYERILVPLLLLGHAGLLAWADTRHSPTIDEVGHLPAAILATGNWDASICTASTPISFVS